MEPKPKNQVKIYLERLFIPIFAMVLVFFASDNFIEILLCIGIYFMGRVAAVKDYASGRIKPRKVNETAV